MEYIPKIMENLIKIMESILKLMENIIKKYHGKCFENHGKAAKNDGPELLPVGGQAWKIPNLEANGAQHLLQKEYLSGKEKACEISFGIC